MRAIGLKTFATLLLLAAVSAAADTSSDELRRLEDAWNRAHVSGDADALLAMARPDATIIVPSMPPFTPQEAFGVLRSGHMKFETYQTSELHFAVVACTGVVTGRLKRVRIMGDRRVEDDWTFTKTWVRDGGTWRLLAYHAAPAP